MKKQIKCCGCLKKCFSILTGMIMIVLLILTPIMIFRIFKEEKYLGFLGGYIGAVLTLMGVWLQIHKLEQHRKNDEEERREKSEEEKNERERERKLGVLKYLEFVLEQNIEGAKENDCAYTMQANLLYLTSWASYKEEGRVFTKFKSQFIDNNLNVIMEFGNNTGEDILKMERLLVNAMEDYTCLLKNKKKRKVLFESLKGNEELKDKDMKIYNILRSKEGKMPSDEIEKEMKKIIEGIGEKLLGSQREEKWEEMWGYHLLDINLNGKGFEIIKKSEKLMKKIEKEINGL